MQKAISLLLVCLSLTLGACASTVSLPVSVVDSSTNLKQADSDNARAAWARVLRQYVDEQGRVDFSGLAQSPQDLETWLAYVARVSPARSPASFPDRNSQLAYYIDAYNALAMYGAVRSGVVPAQKIRFFLLRRYLIGGEEMSLYAFENDVIRKLGEANVHVALNCMAVSCPRLPQIPWDASLINQQLEKAAYEFFNSSKHVQINNTEKIVYLSEILDFFSEDFLATAPSLIAYVNRYRDQAIPENYEIRFIPYDWSLNVQPDSLPSASDNI